MTGRLCSYKVSGSAPELYPADTFFGLLYYDADEALEIPKRYPYGGEWGKPLSTHLLERERYPMPGKLDIVWLSVVERKFYSLTRQLPVKEWERLWEQTDDKGAPLFEYIVVGMAPYGGVAVWFHGVRKSVLAAWMKAEEIEVDMRDFMPSNPDMTLDGNCDFYIDGNRRVRRNLLENGLPPRNLYERKMHQFTYRYLPLFGTWDEGGKVWTEDSAGPAPEFDYVDEELSDGTHDRLRDGSRLKYHQGGKPVRLTVAWHVGRSEYVACFRFDGKRTGAVFDRIYGVHRDTKTDLILRIDPRRNKFEWALYRYGLKAPAVLEEDAWQLIVFENKFECHRSKNYRPEAGPRL